MTDRWRRERQKNPDAVSDPSTPTSDRSGKRIDTSRLDEAIQQAMAWKKPPKKIWVTFQGETLTFGDWWGIRPGQEAEPYHHHSIVRDLRAALEALLRDAATPPQHWQDAEPDAVVRVLATRQDIEHAFALLAELNKDLQG